MAETRGEYAICHLYEAEDGIRDYAAALEWCRRAAAQGHKDAQCRLAQMFAQGLGVQESAQEAAKWQALADQRPAVESDPYGGTDETGMVVLAGAATDRPSEAVLSWRRVCWETVPIFETTRRIEALPGIASSDARKARKPLMTSDMSQCFAKTLCRR